jgi:hypothetical protein
MIHWHPRSRYGRNESNYYGLLNLDQYGDKIIDEDKLQQAWHDKVMNLHPHLFESEWIGYELQLREELANEPMDDDYEIATQCEQAWVNHEFDDTWIEAAAQRIEDALHWNYDNEHDKCWKGPEKGVVMLDCYEHGGISLSVSGSGMQCQWDTSRGAAVWAPDSCAMDEIDRRAAVYAFGRVENNHAGKWIAVDTTAMGGYDVGEFDDWGTAFAALSQHCAAYTTDDPEQLALGVQRAAEEVCEAALDQYNAWANGDCWVVWSQRFELRDGQWVEVGESDCCGGYIGDEWAEQEMQDRLHFNHWPTR